MEERFFRFSNLSCYPEIIHGISNRGYGDMRFGNLPDEEVIKNRQQFFRDLSIESSKVAVAGQIHGNKIAIIDKQAIENNQKVLKAEISGADGLMTRDKEIFLMVKTADCLPILMYDPSLRIAAALHAGWRGIIDQIVPSVIDKFISCGSQIENLVVGIGPGICQKHFVVKNSVLTLFLENYPSTTFVRNYDGYIDLKKAVVTDLKKRQVHPGNIEIAHFCTYCDNGTYGSYRKEGKGASEIASVIGIKN